MSTISKHDMVASIADNAELSQKDVSAVLNSFMNEVIKEVSDGNKVQLMGFGTFESRHRNARKGRNPQTGEEIDIPAAEFPAFKPGKGFKDAVNKK